MEFNNNGEMFTETCRQIRTLLSDYSDNTLSARQTWDVEKHISLCPACAIQAQQMQLTVQMLREAPRCDTGDDFMAKLHARLDVLEPELARAPSLATQLRDWAAGVQDRLRVRSLPRVGMALALSCVATLLILPLLPQNGSTPTAANNQVVKSVPQPIQNELDRHIADVAGDPLGDVAAAKLTAHLNPGEDANGGEVE